MRASPKKQEWMVVYRVKFSEVWCADECEWIEESAVVEAATPHEARKEYRRIYREYRRVIIGRHISTRKVRRLRRGGRSPQV